jgi:hypothetical protein
LNEFCSWIVYYARNCRKYMNSLKCAVLSIVLVGALAAPRISLADDTKTAKPKPYTLTTCIVSDDKLGGEMGKPFVYIYKDKKLKDDPGREIKFCCKSCLKDFNKDPAAYMKKIDAAEAKANAKK